MEHNINMAFGKPERITFTAEPQVVSSLIDAFGKGIRFSESEDGTFLCSVNVPLYDMESLALQYGNMITVISPQNLVEQIKKNIQHLQSNYGL